MSEGLKVIGFVEGLPNRSVPESWNIESHHRAADALDSALHARIARMNERLRRIPGFEDKGSVLTDEGRIDADAFHADQGGPYGQERIMKDRESVKLYEQDFPGLVSPEKRFHDGELGEGAALCVLNRFLGNRFLIVRTSKYDDYRNLVDFMVVDLEKGGKPICAIDEIVGSEEGNDRVRKKKERLNREQGMRLRYGVAAKDDGTLELGEFAHLPGIYAAIERKDLKALFESGADLSSDDGEPSEAEWGFFDRIIGSMRQYITDVALPPDSPVYEFLRVAEERLNRHLSE
ncbi:MAG: hypothetical protein WCJ25_02220 [Candidatus Moraniibacteriota bacterium]